MEAIRTKTISCILLFFSVAVPLITKAKARPLKKRTIEIELGRKNLGEEENLLDRKPRLNLCGAAQSGTLDQMRRLLADDADIDAPDGEGCTPLILASSYINASKVELLLKKKASLNKQDGKGFTALMRAVERCCEFEGGPQLNIVSILCAYDADTSIINDVGQNVFYLIRRVELGENDDYRTEYFQRLKNVLSGEGEKGVASSPDK